MRRRRGWAGYAPRADAGVTLEGGGVGLLRLGGSRDGVAGVVLVFSGSCAPAVAGRR